MSNKGTALWAHTAGGAGQDHSAGGTLAITANQEVLMVGNFGGSGQFTDLRFSAGSDGTTPFISKVCLFYYDHHY